MKAYVLTKHIEDSQEEKVEHTYFAFYGGTAIKLADCTNKQQLISPTWLNQMIQRNEVQEIELKNYKWLFPHLYLPIKEIVQHETGLPLIHKPERKPKQPYIRKVE